MLTALTQTTRLLTDAGIPLPLALKGRDPLEPGLGDKERTEKRLYGTMRGMFRRQETALRTTLEAYAPERKVAFGFDEQFYLQQANIDPTATDIAALERILREAAMRGITLFDDAVSFSLDYTIVNDQAARWANAYAAQLIKGVSSTTRKVVRSVIADFVKTPGMTIGDVVSRLPFTNARAWLVAVTETTNTYSSASIIAGRALEKSFPGVAVIKHWYTNNDDRVCLICGPLHGQEVPLNKTFKGGDGARPEKPSAHVGCRCWMSVTTRLR